MQTYLDGLTAVHDGEHVYRPITNDPNKRFTLQCAPRCAHASCHRQERHFRQSLLYDEHCRSWLKPKVMACSKCFISTVRTPISMCAFAGSPNRLPSGTTVARGISPSGITFRRSAQAIASRLLRRAGQPELKRTKQKSGTSDAPPFYLAFSEITGRKRWRR